MPENLKLSQIGTSLSRSKKTLSNYLCLLLPEIVYWANFCFANLLGSIRWTATKLYSGSKNLRSTCSGNIRPIRRILPLTGWDQSSPVDEAEIKIKMDDGVARFFTKRIIVRRTVRSMFGEQTFAQLRTGFRFVSRRTSVRICFGSPFSSKDCGLWTLSCDFVPHN